MLGSLGQFPKIFSTWVAPTRDVSMNLYGQLLRHSFGSSKPINIEYCLNCACRYNWSAGELIQVWALVATLSAFLFSLICPNGLSFATGQNVNILEGKIWLAYAVRRSYPVKSEHIPIPPWEKIIDLLFFFNIFEKVKDRIIKPLWVHDGVCPGKNRWWW